MIIPQSSKDFHFKAAGARSFPILALKIRCLPHMKDFLGAKERDFTKEDEGPPENIFIPLPR